MFDDTSNEIAIWLKESYCEVNGTTRRKHTIIAFTIGPQRECLEFKFAQSNPTENHIICKRPENLTKATIVIIKSEDVYKL